MPKVKAQRSERGAPDPELRSRHSPFPAPHPGGFTYMALLASIIILGIMLGSAGKYWSNVMQRDREEELFSRGDQYRNAIERYYNAIPGKPQLPPNIEALLSDGRTSKNLRHLRQRYKDPFTGNDFELIRDPTKGNGIVGVFSPSTLGPLKQAGFPEKYDEFNGKTSYSEWKFVYKVQQPGQPGRRPGTPPPPK